MIDMCEQLYQPLTPLLVPLYFFCPLHYPPPLSSNSPRTALEQSSKPPLWPPYTPGRPAHPPPIEREMSPSTLSSCTLPSATMLVNLSAPLSEDAFTLPCRDVATIFDTSIDPVPLAVACSPVAWGEWRRGWRGARSQVSIGGDPIGPIGLIGPIGPPTCMKSNGIHH